MWRVVQIKSNHEGDRNFDDSDDEEVFVEEENQQGKSCEDLEHVEPEVASVDSEFNQKLISLLWFGLDLNEGIHYYHLNT